jgi:hypothetical protein
MMIGRLIFSLVIFIVVVALVTSSSINAASKGSDSAALFPDRKFNKFYQLLMTKLVEVRYKAESYMIQNDIPMAPSKDYP